MARSTVDITGIFRGVNSDREVGSSSRIVQIIVEESGDTKYVNHWVVDLWNDKIEFLDRIRVGDLIVCHCQVNGRKWTTADGEDKYFLSLFCFGIGDPNKKKSPKQDTDKEEPAIEFPDNESESPEQDTGGELEDDLPF